MAGKGPAPKPAHLRQRTNHHFGGATLEASSDVKVPAIPNPDPTGRTWHPLTKKAWQHAWTSPMASQWLETDIDALGRLAVLWDEFYKAPDAKVMAEIRLQEQRFGLSPLDRSRLQWEIRRAEEPSARNFRTSVKRPGADPRSVLMAVK